MSITDTQISMVLVDLTEIPAAGHASKLIRLRGDDSDLIDIATKILGVGQGQFLRMATINVAKKIIAETTRDGK